MSIWEGRCLQNWDGAGLDVFVRILQELRNLLCKFVALALAQQPHGFWQPDPSGMSERRSWRDLTCALDQVDDDHLLQLAGFQVPEKKHFTCCEFTDHTTLIIGVPKRGLSG
jgi:hypothetical protein